MPPKQQRGGGTPNSGKGPRPSGGKGVSSSSPKSGPHASVKAASGSNVAESRVPVGGAAKAKPVAVKPASVLRNVDYNPSVHAGQVSSLGASELQIQQELKFLDDYLHTIGKVRLAIAKDGACLFRSMAQSLFGIQSLHLKVREACVNHLLAHEDDFLYFIDIVADMSDTEAAHDEYLAYAEKLRGPTAWGGQVEIQALSQFYLRNFEIYQAVSLRNASDTTLTSEPTHEIATTRIFNDHAQTIYLAYSHGNHYDVVLDLHTIESMGYFQKLAHHTIETFFQAPNHRNEFFLRSLAFEEPPTSPLTPSQALEEYDNRQWKIWQGLLQREKSSDEQMARRIIAEETGTVSPEERFWATVGSTKKSNKKKNTANDSLAQQQAHRMAEITSSPSTDLDAQLARSLDENLNAPAETESLQGQMDADERLARQMMDEQLALQLSRELNPDSPPSTNPSVPGSTTSNSGDKTKQSSASTHSLKSPSGAFPRTSADSSSSSELVDDDGFMPANKKARAQAVKAAAMKKNAEDELRRKELLREEQAKKDKEMQATKAKATRAAKQTAPNNTWSTIAQNLSPSGVSPSANISSANPSAPSRLATESTATPPKATHHSVTRPSELSMISSDPPPSQTPSNTIEKQKTGHNSSEDVIHTHHAQSSVQPTSQGAESSHSSQSAQSKPDAGIVAAPPMPPSPYDDSLESQSAVSKQTASSRPVPKRSARDGGRGVGGERGRSYGPQGNLDSYSTRGTSYSRSGRGVDPRGVQSEYRPVAGGSSPSPSVITSPDTSHQSLLTGQHTTHATQATESAVSQPLPSSAEDARVQGSDPAPLPPQYLQYSQQANTSPFPVVPAMPHYQSPGLGYYYPPMQFDPRTSPAWMHPHAAQQYQHAYSQQGYNQQYQPRFQTVPAPSQPISDSVPLLNMSSNAAEYVPSSYATNQ